jgi:hypothetical protein
MVSAQLLQLGHRPTLTRWCAEANWVSDGPGWADYSRFVTRAPGTGQQRWLGDVQMSFMLLNWADLYQRARRGRGSRYRSPRAAGGISPSADLVRRS